MSSDYHDEEALERELEQYRKILQKLRQEQNKELSKTTKISKPIALSNLKSPISKSNVELSNNELDDKIKYCVNCLIKYGSQYV
jgi:hypothetical protein